MPTIQVPVLWDQDNQFLNNALYTIDVASTVVGVVSKPTRIFPPQEPNPTMQSCIQVRTPTFLTFYINLTLTQYQALIARQTPYQHTFVFKVEGINTSVLGITSLGVTDPLFNRFIVTGAKYVTKAFSGVISTSPIISIGDNASSYDDIVNSTTLSGASAHVVDNPVNLAVSVRSLSVAPSTIININISTAATFVEVGQFIIDVYVHGYYEVLNPQ